MLWFIILFFALAAVIFTFSKLNAKKLKKRQLAGLAKIEHLKSLISLTQQHRGLSSALINGDRSVEKMLRSQERDIAVLIQKLNATNLNQLNCRWASFLDHWQRLKHVNNKSDALNNFKQHTLLIGNLLYLVEDEAECSQLTASNINELPTLGYVWRELIMTTENVGQTRAIGTGVATIGSCGQVDRIRLSFLEQHITQTSEQILSQLTCTSNEKATHDRLLSNAFNKMKKLSDVINSELLVTKKVHIRQSDYFDIASDTIAALNAIFDHQVKQVRQLI